MSVARNINVGTGETELPDLARRRGQIRLRGQYVIERVDVNVMQRLRVYRTRAAWNADLTRDVYTAPSVTAIVLDTGIIGPPDFSLTVDPEAVFNGITLFWTLDNHNGIDSALTAKMFGEFEASVPGVPRPDDETTGRTEAVILPPQPVSTVRVPKLAVPFQIRTARAVVVEQDSTDEIVQTTKAILRTEVGSHIDDPDLGIPDPSFSTASLDDLHDAVARSEPRARTVFSADDIDDLYEQTVEIQLEEEER